MSKSISVASLEKLGRIRLSKSFFLRDFLFSEVAMVHGMVNAPNDVDAAVHAGGNLCEQLLEPLQARFGRLAIRSAYRSPKVNEFGNARGYNCASNEANAAGHIWDLADRHGRVGATACIVVPSFIDSFEGPSEWKRLAWWIHDHLPYSEMEFFKPLWAFNLSWHDRPKREIRNWIETPRCLTKPGLPNHQGSHAADWAGIEKAFTPC